MIRKIRNTRTGEITEIEESQFSQYNGLSAPPGMEAPVADTPTTPTPTPSIQAPTQADTTTQTQPQEKDTLTGYTPEEHIKALKLAREDNNKTQIKQINEDLDRELDYQKTLVAEAKGDEKSDKAMVVIDQLEKLYFGEGEDNPLAYAQPGALFSRGMGTIKNIERLLKPGKRGSEIERLNTFKRTLESKRALLAKAAGDAGNLAYQEQILAGKGIPDPSSTIGEAIGLFESSRAAFGLEPSKRVEEAKVKFKEEAPREDITPGVGRQPTKVEDQAGILFKSASDLAKQAAIEKDPKKKELLLRQSREAAAEARGVAGQKKPIPEEVTKTAADVQKFLGKTETLPIIYSILGRGIAGGSPFGSGLGAATGEYGRQILGKGGVEGLTPSKAESDEIVKKGVTYGALDALLLKGLPKVLQPFKTVGKIRTARLIEAQGKTISGDKVLGGLREASKNVSPTAQARFIKFIEAAEKTYKGKKIPLDRVLTLKKEANEIAFLESGKAGRAVISKFNKVLGGQLRKELKVTDKEVAAADKLFTKLFTGKRVTKDVIRRFGPMAAGALILNKLLGVKSGF